MLDHDLFPAGQAACLCCAVCQHLKNVDEQLALLFFRNILKIGLEFFFLKNLFKLNQS